MHIRLFALAMLTGFFNFSAPAMGEEQGCMARSEMLTGLNGKYGEERRSLGLDRRGLVEVFTSADSGSWTITLTTPEGITCMIAAGQHFEATPDPLILSDSDA